MLQPVGGKGQEALLAAPVLVFGLPITAAYLAAGGTPIHTRSTTTTVHPESSRGTAGGDAVSAAPPLDGSGHERERDPFIIPRKTGFFAAAALSDFNPDAVPTAPPAGLVARVPFEFPADQPLAVAVGGDGVVFRATGCAHCFARTVKSLSLEAPTVELEALGALAWQRIVLGLADTLGALRPMGPPLTVLRCEAHA